MDMFTGLIEALGQVKKLAQDGPGCELALSVPFTGELVLGESVAVNGVCLTVVDSDESTCRFQLAPETLSRTNLGQLKQGDRVNLERSLRVGDRMGGHFVQGHVDAVGHISRRISEGEWVTMWFACPAHLTLQMAPKGSIAVDGISLTLVEVRPDEFSVALIPHTLDNTTLGFKNIGDAVNLETDVLAKYVTGGGWRVAGDGEGKPGS
jgi:riboflavin synthase